MLELPVLDFSFALLCATVLVAGVARGMAGFGTGLIVAPMAGALYGPQAAVAIIVIMDSLPSLPVSGPAMRVARWREVFPVMLGMACLLPVGVMVLKHADPLALRWCVCLVIVLCAFTLWRGWRYRGPRNTLVSFSVGGVAGTLSGIASIPGPPVIVYWLASSLPAKIVRANLLTLFWLSEFLSFANLWAAGLLDRRVVSLGLAAALPYFAGLMIGSRLYGLATDETYRRITFSLIVLSAVLALPVIDPLFALLKGTVGP